MTKNYLKTFEKRNYRYERTMIAPLYDKEEINITFQNNKHIISNAYSPRLINSIYFDDNSLSLAKQNINGDSNRMKIRIRYYGESILFSEPYWEVKRKNGLVGFKERHKLSRSLKLLKDFSSYSFCSQINLQSLNPNLLEGLKPIIFVSYLRTYHLSRCSKFRFTYDTNIKFQEIGSHIDFDNLNSIESDFDIIEIKYQREYDHLFNKYSGILPYRITRNSKYIMGLKAIGRI